MSMEAPCGAELADDNDPSHNDCPTCLRILATPDEPESMVDVWIAETADLSTHQRDMAAHALVGWLLVTHNRKDAREGIDAALGCTGHLRLVNS